MSRLVSHSWRYLVCSIQSIPKLRFCNLGCRLLLNQHHQHGSRRPRMFRPYSMNPLVAGGPTVVINHCALVDCFQLISSRLSHSQLDARSAAWLSLWIALFLSLPLVLGLLEVSQSQKVWYLLGRLPYRRQRVLPVTLPCPSGHLCKPRRGLAQGRIPVGHLM